MYSEDMNSGATAIARTKVSVPTQYLIDHNYLYGHVLHFGEGKAYQDTEAMLQVPGVSSVTPYDPNSEHVERRTYDRTQYFNVVVCNYVLNTLPAVDRVEALLEVYRAGTVAYIAVRTDKVKVVGHADGVITSKNTFQTQLTAAGWMEWITRTFSKEFPYVPRITIMQETRNYLMLEVR